MIVSLDGKRVKLKRPYTTDEIVRMFKDNYFYLYGAKVVDEGTLVDLFGPVVIEILDRMLNSALYKKVRMTDEKPCCSLYGGDFVDGNFRAVNLGGFGEVASMINEQIVMDNYAYTGGKIVQQVFAEREEAEKRRKEEARAKRAAARAAKKATEG